MLIDKDESLICIKFNVDNLIEIAYLSTFNVTRVLIRKLVRVSQNELIKQSTIKTGFRLNSKLFSATD